MPREISEATKKDLDWLKLQEQIRKIILNKKEWLQFKKYMKIYYD